MKRWVRSLLTFNSLEQKGIAALFMLCILLLLVYIVLPYFIPEKQFINDPELAAAYEKYKQSHLTEDQTADDDTESSYPVRQLFKFDPNKLDSNGFVTLGMRPNTVHLLLSWRRRGKVFRNKQELAAVYTLTKGEYERLEPYIQIDEKALYPDKYWPENEAISSVPVDLNLADSGSLVHINGIGPVLAHKILERRKALGGFVKYEQLNEVYRFPDTTFQLLKEKLVINASSIRKLKLNACTYQELSAHPYIGAEMAKNIILFREGLKHYNNIEQLRQVPLMNEENYRKIAPYLVVE